MSETTGKFNVRVYASGRGFNIPVEARKRLGIRGGDSVLLDISDESGEKIFYGRKELKSGSEIYGSDLAAKLKPEMKIQIVASEPIFSGALEEETCFVQQEQAAGYQADPEIRRIVEKHAMKLAEYELQSRGFTEIADKSSSESFDLLCKFCDVEHCVEVKGTQGSGKAVILTKNEVDHAKNHPGSSIMIVVSRIRVTGHGEERQADGGRVRVWAPWVPREDELRATQYLWTTQKRSTKKKVQVVNASNNPT